jgi:hypothetical protein
MFVLLLGEIYEMVSDGIIYTLSFLKIWFGIQVILMSLPQLLVLLMGRISEVHSWDGLRWRDVHKTIHDDRFRHSSNIKGITTAIWEGFVEYAVQVS